MSVCMHTSDVKCPNCINQVVVTDDWVRDMRESGSRMFFRIQELEKALRRLLDNFDHSAACNYPRKEGNGNGFCNCGIAQANKALGENNA